MVTTASPRSHDAAHIIRRAATPVQPPLYFAPKLTWIPVVSSVSLLLRPNAGLLR